MEVGKGTGWRQLAGICPSTPAAESNSLLIDLYVIYYMLLKVDFDLRAGTATQKPMLVINVAIWKHTSN
jgi:hypothetical protein